MSKGPHPFKETDVMRACNGVKKAGLIVSSVEIDKSGKITVITQLPKPDVPQTDVNLFDLEAERLRREA